MALNKSKNSKRSKKNNQASGDISLNITAMADIFVVLLVFLLKSYAGGALAVNTTTQLELPAAKNTGEIVEALQVEISAKHVVVDGEAVVDLEDFRFPAGDVLNVGLSKKLFETLKARKETRTDEKQMIVLADKETPYAALKVVLTSAAGTGYSDYKMAVMGVE